MQWDCTDLFTDVQWADVHIDGHNEFRMNIQQRNVIHCVHVRIDKLAPFIDHVRESQREHAKLKAERA
jgi:hypothetical protein